ncbi:hypothetical protein LHYA1_G004193 [Lachnellula hyalina]|uniref:Uncharacterized protein n=1 Tax=Lachnellula hyalina TaxID=1316788 RepID=A0A8H8R4B0_9HELO|nr:uncharacterized protein LHYA1_G004193 [Lachnellula hyalina]TVY27396.1 hypothetical protein LHYA1_G004193 [Lachnellula hyalina]
MHYPDVYALLQAMPPDFPTYLDPFLLDPALFEPAPIDHHVYHPPIPAANAKPSAETANMPPKMKTGSSVPLICSLCPKSPKFSDISHLLTHISSKSHLAALFKLKIRSQAEQHAKDKVDEYELWYSGNDLDTLLSDRLATKDQKKRNKDKKSRLSNASKSPVKKEEVAYEPALDSTPLFRAPVPLMHPYNPAKSRESVSMEDDWGFNSLYDTPTVRRRVPNFADSESPVGRLLDPKLKTPSRSAIEKKSKNGDKIPDSAQLKGALWPGMDLFDSATPEMKRMRNQRKDVNVMRQMKARSAEIEPAEISYFADGEFRASRDIFGPLSDAESPAKDPTPKRQRRTRKPTLKEVSINAPRLRASRSKKAAGKSPQKQYALMNDNVPAVGLFRKPVPNLNPLAPGPAFGQNFAPTTEEEEEFKMTIGGLKKKPTMGVFQDAPGESPSGQTESSLEDHRFDLPNNGLPLYQNNSTTISHISPTPVPKAIPARSLGKENMHSHMPTRQSASYPSHVYPSQILYNPSSNPLYNHAYAGTFGYGDHHNPFNDVKFSPAFAPNPYADLSQTAQPARARPRNQSGKAKSGSGPGFGSASVSASASGMNDN